jgi:hypothetical protein
MSGTNSGFAGLAQPNSGATDANALAFIVQALINNVATSTLVVVKAVAPYGGGPVNGLPAGNVAVQPMVDQVDGFGNAIPHGVIYNLPYYYLQGGGNAVQIDPAVGDIGLAVFADHDISNVKTALQPTVPGSNRRFDMADGLYFGAFPSLNGAITQFLKFVTGGGIELEDSFGNTMVTGNGAITMTTTTLVVNGAITATGNITAGQGGADQVGLQTHKHPTAATGSPSSPTPGT